MLHSDDAVGIRTLSNGATMSISVVANAGALGALIKGRLGTVGP